MARSAYRVSHRELWHSCTLALLHSGGGVEGDATPARRTGTALRAAPWASMAPAPWHGREGAALRQLIAQRTTTRLRLLAVRQLILQTLGILRRTLLPARALMPAAAFYGGGPQRMDNAR